MESNAFPSRSWLQRIHHDKHHKVMRVAGLGPKKRNMMTKALQETVEKASHWMWLNREDTSWRESWWLTRKAHIWTGEETSHRWGGSVCHKKCREEEPETVKHSLLMISTPKSGIRSCQLKAAQEAVLIYLVSVFPVFLSFRGSVWLGFLLDGVLVTS